MLRIKRTLHLVATWVMAHPLLVLETLLVGLTSVILVGQMLVWAPLMPASMLGLNLPVWNGLILLALAGIFLLGRL